MSVGLIIPCFNNADNLNVSVIKKIIKSYSKLKLCFVNNGSTDKTLILLDKLQNKFEKQVSVIDMKKKKGKKSAIKAGSRFLYSLDKINTVGCLEPNLSSDFSKIKILIEDLKNKD